MNIFGVGAPELVVIFLIMLVVAGPKRMIRWAFVLGQYVAKFRKMWSEVVDVMQKEIDEAGVDVKIPKELPTRQNISKVVASMAKPYTDELEKAAKEIQEPVKETLQAADKAMKEATIDLDASASSETETETTAKKTIPVATENLGKWAGQQKKEAATSDNSPQSSENGKFGAWSNPQHPSKQVEQEQ
ncbi:MAG: twin-arginine translocase TatA/TatE family subunit [Anaerolineae bacterium]|nr:twin-arginine translocase TatA/TatE family subunit [Anaerolineae bacterium]